MQRCSLWGMESCDHAFVYRESLSPYARLHLLCEKMPPARRYGWPLRWLLSLACLIFIGASLLPGSEVVFASTSAILRVSPTGFRAGGNCTSGGGGWTCMATVRETGSSQGKLDWTASSSLGGVSFIPSGGTLSPGESSTVTVFVPRSDCSYGSFTFTGQTNTVRRVWSCQTAPLPPPAPLPSKLMVSPGSLDPTSARCSRTGDTYQCAIAIRETATSRQDVNWTASSSLKGVSFSQVNGQLSPGSTTRVIITGIPCQNGTFTFVGSGGASPVTVWWSCTPSQLPPAQPPVLTVRPGSLDPMSARCSSTGSSSLSGITFNPAREQLSPGRYETVTIAAIPCQSGSFTFAGVAGTMLVKVAWSCSGSSASLTNGNSLSFTSQPTGALTLNGMDQIVSYTFTFTLNNTTTQGWHVVITSTQLTTGSAPYYSLPTTASSVTDVTAVCQSGSCNAPQNQVVYPIVVPAGNPAPSPVTFYNSAGNNTGTGAFTVTATIQVVVPDRPISDHHSQDRPPRAAPWRHRCRESDATK